MVIDYPSLYTKVYKRPALCASLRAVSLVAVVASVASVFLSITLAALGSGVIYALRLASAMLVPFVLVSLFRRVVNLKRPCEVFDLEAFGVDTAGFKTGRSFPSRHVFSGFLIATTLFPTLPVLGAVLLLLTTALGAARVLLGIHFLRDCVAGALLGTLSAIIGLLIFGI